MVRTAAARTQNMNNLKQIVLATHGYHDANKRMPDYYSYVYYPSNAGCVSGTATFEILPYLDQLPVYNQAYGNLSYGYNETYNGNSYKYNYSFGVNGYQAGRASGVLAVFVSKTDPTIQQTDTAPCSFFFNTNCFSYTYSEWSYNYSSTWTMDKITDGTSNTIFWAEGYYNCGQSENYNYGYFIYNYSDKETRPWNYDPNIQTYSYTFSFSYSGGVYNETYSYNGPTYPYFYAGVYNYTTYQYSAFEFMPAAQKCTPGAAQASTSAGLCVAFGDGSVRIISSSCSYNTFYYLTTPSSGDMPGNDSGL
jgi:hypothetical protein